MDDGFKLFYDFGQFTIFSPHNHNLTFREIRHERIECNLTVLAETLDAAWHQRHAHTGLDELYLRLQGFHNGGSTDRKLMVENHIL